MQIAARLLPPTRRQGHRRRRNRVHREDCEQDRRAGKTGMEKSVRVIRLFRVRQTQALLCPEALR